MKKIGCLAVFAVVAIVAFATRDLWLSRLDRQPSVVSPAPGVPVWQSLTPAGAQHAKRVLDQLRSPSGPAYASVAPGDLAAYIIQELSRALPSSADSVEAAAIGDRLYVRAVVRISELGDKGALGPLALLLGDRERLRLGGTLRIIRPGLAELQVKEFKIRDLSLPQPLIPRLIGQMSRRDRPPEMSPNGLPLKTPEYIGDVRVSDGQITLYRAAAR